MKGNILVEGNEPVPMKFELDRGRLLNLLVGHTIYNDPTVAVRELLQNAIDAVRFRRYLDAKEVRQIGQTEPPMGSVNVYWDPKTRELIVEDHGIGMDSDVITHHLMRVGASFYDTPQFHAEHVDFTPISRFGIGILTSFMISDDIEIVTCRQDGGFRIKLTSVQADYLLKTLEPGHVLLEGLEPHGTRVRLKVRTSVDLETRSMIDIVRYWIILPACEVSFLEKGKEPQRIGFESVADAVRHYHLSSSSETEKQADVSFEVIDFKRMENAESYELALVVRKGYTPERNIVYRTPTDSPAVCIEGIRAHMALPGFERFYHGAMSALLSVRGNRNLRTTVSRTSLELDEEYARVGEICAGMLCSHTRDEVRRIAAMAGGPLSRASTAGVWVHRSVCESASHEAVKKCLSEAYAKLPVIVVESVEVDAGKVTTRRDLATPARLQQLMAFWTVESRLVDYLGIISRDLGKELSLHDFLGTLAPEFTDPRITPLIPDPHYFADVIRTSHSVSQVEFSRRHQQTLIEWKQRQETLPKTDTNKLLAAQLGLMSSNEILRELQSAFGRYRTRSSESEPYDFAGKGKELLKSTFVAPVTGDISQVPGITTRIASILAPESRTGQVWSILAQAITKGLQNSSEAESLFWPYLGLCLVAYPWQPSRYTPTEVSLRLIADGWEQVASHLREALASVGLDNRVPGFADIADESSRFFNARAYWWNWERMTVGE